MSLQTRLEALASGVGADIKSITASLAQTVMARATVIGSGDWNTYTTPGTYQVAGGTWTNGPTGAYAFGQLLVFANGTIITQAYITHGTTHAYIRSKYNASDWTVWQSIALSGEAQPPTAHTHNAAAELTGTLADGNLPLRLHAAAADSSVSNPDSAQQSGSYYVSTLTNGPPATTDYFLHVTAYSPSWIRQLAFDSRSIKVWTRFKLGTNNTWSTWTEIYSAASPPPTLAHTHPTSDLTATGTRDATTFLRGDNTWAPIVAGSQTVISDITLAVATQDVTFSSIPQTYKDLMVHVSAPLGTTATNYIGLLVNGVFNNAQGATIGGSTAVRNDWGQAFNNSVYASMWEFFNIAAASGTERVIRNVTYAPNANQAISYSQDPITSLAFRAISTTWKVGTRFTLIGVN